MKYFHELSDDEIKARIYDHWDFSKGYPYPKFEMCCPVCAEKEILLKTIKYFLVPTASKNPRRADVRFKCTYCSHVWVHGVKVPKGEYFEKTTVHWREIKAKLE